MTMPGKTLVAAATTERRFVRQRQSGGESRDGGMVGKAIAERAAGEEDRQSRLRSRRISFITAK